MNRYNITPEVTTDEMRVSVSLLIEENPAGEWVKYEEAAHIIDDLIKQIADLDGEHEQTLEALRVAHETIVEKQAKIEELEARPALDDDMKRFLQDIEWVFTGWEAAINRQGSTVTSGLKELDSLYRKLWPVGSRLDGEPEEKEGAA